MCRVDPTLGRGRWRPLSAPGFRVCRDVLALTSDVQDLCLLNTRFAWESFPAGPPFPATRNRDPWSRDRGAGSTLRQRPCVLAFQVDIRFPQSGAPDPNCVTVTGLPENVEEAIDHILNLEEEYVSPGGGGGAAAGLAPWHPPAAGPGGSEAACVCCPLSQPARRSEAGAVVVRVCRTLTPRLVPTAG